MSQSNRAIWLQEPRPDARVRLLCFPFAGAGANVFRGWERELGDEVEVAAVQLPGREWRRGELPITRMDALVETLAPEIAAWLDGPRPGLFFGYSMGAALAFALAAGMQRVRGPMPKGLIVAACRAPQLLERMRKIFDLSDEDFVAVIRRFGGMPEAVLAEPALLELALPAIRADFEVLNTYVWRPVEPLPCPVTVYGGSEDQLATRGELAQWREHTRREFNLRIFSGGHFFINEARAQLLRTLAADLSMVCA